MKSFEVRSPGYPRLKYSPPSLLIFIFLLLFLSKTAYASPLSQLRDFTLTAEKYNFDRSRYYSIKISLDGHGIYRKVIKTKTYEVDMSEDFKVTDEQLEYLYYKVMSNSFFDLDRAYGQITDSGFTMTLAVKLNEVDRKVFLRNGANIFQVNSIIQAMKKFMPKEWEF